MENRKKEANQITTANAPAEQAAITKISKLNDIFDLLGTNSGRNIDTIVKHACELLEGVCCLYNRLDNSHESLIAWAHHNLPADFNREDTPEGHICFEATIKGGNQPVIIGDIACTEYQCTDPNVAKYRLKSYLGYPVSLGGESIGALCIVDTKTREFTPTDVHIISTLAKALSIEEERKRAEEEIEKLQRLNSVGTLAGGIAHDFNNILMAVFGNITMARLKLPREHPAYAFLEKAEGALDRATNLTTQLLTFAKGGAPVKEVLELGRFLQENVRFVLSGSRVTPRFEVPENLRPIEADHGQMQQVFSNLATNAVHALPEGGELYIAAKNVNLAEQAVPNLAAGKYVMITVRDKGVGIDKEHLNRIFDPYFTTKQTGCGLGLATVYSIITRHNGHISVHSKPGKGATFTLYLPASIALHRAEPRKPERQELSRRASGTILVMDDDEMTREIAVAMVRECGYSVATAASGREAIDSYRQAMQAKEPFVAAILDLTVPGGIGGKEAVKEILAIDPDARVIVSSGYSDDPVLANYHAYGFRGIAAKPYTMRTLQQVLQQVLTGGPPC